MKKNNKYYSTILFISPCARKLFWFSPLTWILEHNKHFSSRQTKVQTMLIKSLEFSLLHKYFFMRSCERESHKFWLRIFIVHMWDCKTWNWREWFYLSHYVVCASLAYDLRQFVKILFSHKDKDWPPKNYSRIIFTHIASTRNWFNQFFLSDIFWWIVIISERQHWARVDEPPKKI